MFGETLTKLGNAAEAKSKFSKNAKGRYTLASGLAGFYVGIGILLIMTIGSLLSGAGSPATKIVMGASFGIALSLVIMAGSELFTGNNLIMTAGALDKRITWKDAGRVWFYSYIGNFLGSALVAGFFVMAGLTNGATGEFIINVASAKMGGAFMPLLAKGILCNILVCLAVLCAVRMQSESGKLIMIWWCLFAFITAGFEHSIANMTIFSIALFMPHPETVSVMGMLNNLIPVTIGNFIGGALLVGGSYYLLGKEK
ncbi:formate/nitrite transporter family protein [Vallitalea okinawensis]|uniref:formate/nitrite transporter family protein n=1 Tax=Vallitalea okinawensis TaxID=2078660 RepID=UPI000CFB92FD|nr:formate/nitrite transporter family protein [Vallitalea okinawensis]